MAWVGGRLGSSGVVTFENMATCLRGRASGVLVVGVSLLGRLAATTGRDDRWDGTSGDCVWNIVPQ